MARHPFSSQGRQIGRIPNRIYIILAVLIVATVIAFIYSRGPSGSNNNENQIEEAAPSTDSGASEADDTILPVQITQEEPKPTQTEIVQLQVVEPIPETAKPDEAQPATETFPETTSGSNSQASDLIAKATALLKETPSKIIEARDKFNEALRMSITARQRAFVKEQLSELSEQWLFNRTIIPGDPLCENYQVRPGDRLVEIGNKFKVPYEMIMEINHISDARLLQAGQMIKVINGPFHAKVHRSTFTMDIYLQNTYVKSYKVGLGREGRETPTGLWRVKPDGKAYATSWRDPDTGRVYQPEDEDYPLGSRWIGLQGLTNQAEGREGFGIHGTKVPEEIGTANSRGCIRMYNGDVIKVYNMLFAGLSTVEVID